MVMCFVFCLERLYFCSCCWISSDIYGGCCNGCCGSCDDFGIFGYDYDSFGGCV